MSKQIKTSKEELEERIKAAVRSNFYTDEGEIWEPFEDWDAEDVEKQCQDIIRSVLIAISSAERNAL